MTVNFYTMTCLTLGPFVILLLKLKLNIQKCFKREIRNMINTVDEVLDFRFIRSSPISTYYETSETKCRLILMDYSCLWSR